MPGWHANLNVLGRYSFRASTPVDGGLRPLRDPTAGRLDQDDGASGRCRTTETWSSRSRP
ncbi:hypothetical protein C1N81_44490 [Streptomyces sp. SGAir0957]